VSYYNFYDEFSKTSIAQIPETSAVQLGCMLKDNWNEITKCIGLYNLCILFLLFFILFVDAMDNLFYYALSFLQDPWFQYETVSKANQE
jgi:hypothetical protein